MTFLSLRGYGDGPFAPTKCPMSTNLVDTNQHLRLFFHSDELEWIGIIGR